MIDIESLKAIVAEYEKYGWQLRHVVLGGNSDSEFESTISRHLNGVKVKISCIDGLWFSRLNKGKETWEIRRLTGPPFALVRFVDSDASDKEREAILDSAEAEIAASGLRPSGH